MRRRTIGGGERERDRCSTPVSSPPLDQFVKTRERSEVSCLVKFCRVFLVEVSLSG